MQVEAVDSQAMYTFNFDIDNIRKEIFFGWLVYLKKWFIQPLSKINHIKFYFSMHIVRKNVNHLSEAVINTLKIIMENG